MPRVVTLQEILTDDELFEAVLEKACFYYILEHPEEIFRLEKKIMKKMHKLKGKTLDTVENIKCRKYNIIVQEWQKAKVFCIIRELLLFLFYFLMIPSSSNASWMAIFSILL